MVQKSLHSHAFNFSIYGTSKDKQALYELVTTYNNTMSTEIEFIDNDGEAYVIIGMDLTNYNTIWTVAKGISLDGSLKMDRQTIDVVNNY